MVPCEAVDDRLKTNHVPEEPSDRELIAAINDGDAAAFEILYRRYKEWVAGLAFRFTGDSDAALDVVQETFLYVLKKFLGFRLTAQFKTFLYPAVRHLGLAARRKAERYQTSTEALAQLENTPSPTGSEPGLAELNVVLAALPEEQREVVLPRFVDGLSLAEIAQAMEIPLGTVKSRLHNALETLRHDERTKAYFEQ